MLAETQRFPLPFSASMGKVMSTRLPLSFNRALVLEAIALIVFAGLVFVSSTASCPTWPITDCFTIRDNGGLSRSYQV
jgi:hypothetical protein